MDLFQNILPSRLTHPTVHGFGIWHEDLYLRELQPGHKPRTAQFFPVLHSIPTPSPGPGRIHGGQVSSFLTPATNGPPTAIDHVAPCGMFAGSLIQPASVSYVQERKDGGLGEGKVVSHRRWGSVPALDVGEWKYLTHQRTSVPSRWVLVSLGRVWLGVRYSMS